MGNELSKRPRWLSVVAFSAIVILYCHPHPLIAESRPGEQPAPLSDEAKTTARQTIETVRKNSAALVSGMYFAKGDTTYHAVVAGQKVDFETPVTLFSAFDLRDDAVRFDRHEKHWSPDGPLEGGGQFVLTPHVMLYRHENWNTVVTNPPYDPGGIDPLQIHCVGLANPGELKRSARMDTLCAEPNGLFTNQYLVEVVPEPNGRSRMTWQWGKDGDVRRTVWFDPKQGGMRVRLEERYLKRKLNPPALVRGEWSAPAHRCLIIWAKQSDVWVPRILRTVYCSGVFLEPYEPEFIESYSLKFDWRIVNEMVDPKLFTKEGLDLPE